jgi:membrane fusion protein (multidrug efflux system)
VIATLDARDYDAAFVRAQAATEEAEAGIARDQAGIEQARAQLATARSQLDLARTERDRVRTLYEQRSLSKQEYDHAMTAAQVAGAQFTATEKAVAAALAKLEVARGKLAVARASLETARLQRSYCAITAPVDGVISRKMAETGDVVAPGEPLCAVVPLGLDELWIEANYKETQLRDIRPGQQATFRADIDPGHTYQGTVESLSPGTGAVFSLLPPENATGNWVKIVQRVPVRIRIDPDEDPDHILRLGLSVSVSIDTHER